MITMIHSSAAAPPAARASTERRAIGLFCPDMTLLPRTSCRTLRFPSWISRSSDGAEIGDLRTVALDHLGQAVGAADALWMQDVALSEQAGQRVEVAGGRLREAVADRGLVLFMCAHDASFAAATRHSIGGTT